MFSQAVIEKLGYYVYFLRDPRTKQIFYVGKGQGNRIFDHIKCAINAPTASDKLQLITEIGADKVEHYILRHGLKDENHALEIESACIDLLGIETLTNEVKGHHSFTQGKKSVSEISLFYDAPEVTITDPVLLITINRYFGPELSPKELYDFTRISWKASARRENAKYVFSVYKGLVREVYEVEKWLPMSQPPQDKGRWYFEGHIAPADIRDKYLNHSVEAYVGARNPLKYVNC